jgi:hypothetical protein
MRRPTPASTLISSAADTLGRLRSGEYPWHVGFWRPGVHRREFDPGRPSAGDRPANPAPEAPRSGTARHPLRGSQRRRPGVGPPGAAARSGEHMSFLWESRLRVSVQIAVQNGHTPPAHKTASTQQDVMKRVTSFIATRDYERQFPSNFLSLRDAEQSRLFLACCLRAQLFGWGRRQTPPASEESRS